MAQTGYTPIQIYSSSTSSNVPAAGSLTNSTLGSELAINITDGKLFYKDNANAVQVIGWKTTPTTAGGTGLTSYTAGDLLYYATGTTLSKLAIGTPYYQLGVNAGGTAPVWQPSATSVLTTQGDLLYASGANTLARLAKNTTATRYLANTGTSNNPSWDQVNLANGVTGTLPTGNGGTGQSSFSAGDLLYYASGTALSKLAIGAANTVMTSSGTAPQWSTSLTLASSATATAFIPSSSTVPTNGMYLPASNTLGLAVNSGSSFVQLSTNAFRVQTTSDNTFNGSLVTPTASIGGGNGVTYNTGITLNQGGYGGTMLLLCSNNYGAGTQTRSAVYILHFYYDGNNVPASTYLGGGNDSWTFSASGTNTLVINGPAGNNQYAFFGCK